MALKSSDVAKWSANDWRMKVKYVKPSGGGAVGVMFVWCRGLGSDLPNYNNPGTSDFVVKPVEGSAAPSKFAEKFMKDAIGALTVSTKPISKKGDAAKFQVVQDVLRVFMTRLEATEKADIAAFRDRTLALPGRPGTYKMSDTDRKLLERWRQVWPSYSGAGAYLVQELANDMLELGDDYKDTKRGIKSVILNRDLMFNLGRLFAVDAVLGNGDRLCAMNPGNILYSSKGGVWAIDSQTILTSYQEIKSLKVKLEDGTGKSAAEAQRDYNFAAHVGSRLLDQTPKQWATNISRSAVTQLPSGGKLTQPKPVLAPDFTMKHLHDPKTWFDKKFKLELLTKADEYKLPQSDRPSDSEWNGAFVQFEMGLKQGLKEVDDKLSGLNWSGVKGKFKQYTERYGGDPNMDWTNFKMRRMYIKAIRAGKDEKEALTICQAYAERKLRVSDSSV